MFTKILVPVDLGHIDKLEKALAVAAEEAQTRAIPIVYMAAAEETPGPVSRDPQEFAAKLNAFAAQQADAHGITTEAVTIVSTDPAVEINKLILKAARDSGADLIIMASHPPRMLDWILPSHGGHVAEHADVSVFVIR